MIFEQFVLIPRSLLRGSSLTISTTKAPPLRGYAPAGSSATPPHPPGIPQTYNVPAVLNWRPHTTATTFQGLVFQLPYSSKAAYGPYAARSQKTATARTRGSAHALYLVILKQN
jgi:hypothetical protein